MVRVAVKRGAPLFKTKGALFPAFVGDAAARDGYRMVVRELPYDELRGCAGYLCA